MFGNQSGDDYRKLKEDRRVEREDTRYVEQCFKLGIGNSLDKMLDAVTGNYHTPRMPNEPDKITASIRPGMGGSTRSRTKTASDYDNDDEAYDGPEHPAGYAPYPTKAPPQRSSGPMKYAEIATELDRFRFASDPDKRKKQFAAINVAIRDALQDLIVKDVAQNTKTAFKDHLDKFYKLSGGVKVVYDFENTKIAVSARGAFFGDETICIYRDGDKIKGGVARIDGSGEAEDISANYSIAVERIPEGKI